MTINFRRLLAATALALLAPSGQAAPAAPAGTGAAPAGKGAALGKAAPSAKPVKPATAADVTRAIAAGKPGSTVAVPAGTFDLGDITVPQGVSLRGAGYKNTIINAAAFDNGIIVKQNGKVTISDLTIQGARATGIAISESTEVAVRRVRVLGNSIGVMADGITGLRLENVVASNNRTGVALLRSESAAVVNCTVVNNSNLSLNLTGTKATAVFNNLFIGSQTGVSCGDNTGLALDHNLYVAFFVGGLVGKLTRESLPAWRDLSGYDRHSVELAVDFADIKQNDYRPITPLPWAPVRTTASDWGVAELAGVKAPATDIDGKARSAGVDLGCYEVALAAPRSADGKFTVKDGGGVTSAGLYTAQGKNVAFLFHNLPLLAGTYDYWLPAGLKIEPGDYELRTAESNLRLQYIKMIGNAGVTNALPDASSIDPALIVFDAAGRPILLQGGAEDHQHVRGFDAEMKSARWVVRGGGGSLGAAVDAANQLYYLRAGNGGVDLFKVDAESGQGVPIAKGSFRKLITGVFSAKVAGMTELGGRLYAADTEKNKLFHTSTTALTFVQSFDVPAPRWPAADAPRKLIWLISGDKLVALDAVSGAVKHAAQPVENPASLSISNGRMAIGSPDERLVRIFDCTDPAKLKPVASIGAPWGEADAAGVIVPARVTGAGPVAINTRGEVATIDSNAKLFAADGTLINFHTALWGQHTPSGMWTGPDGKAELNFAGINASPTIIVDTAGRTWRTGYNYRNAPGPVAKDMPPTLAGLPGDIVCLFTEGGRNFAVYSNGNGDQAVHVIVAYDKNFVGKAVLGYKLDAKTNAMVAQTDSNNDGLIDDTDTPTPLQTPAGVAIPGLRFMQDGRLIAGGNIIPRQGVDASGAPSYDWSKYAPRPIGALKYAGQGSFNGEFLTDGGWIMAAGPTRGFGGGFTAFEALDADGTPRWNHPIDYHSTTGAFRSMRVLPGVVLGMATEELDTVAVDHDGLGLGVIGPGPDLKWHGYWHDQDWSIRTWTGEDGKRYLVLGDYVRHGYHWFEVQGVDAVQHGKAPLIVTAPQAALIAGAPVPANVVAPRPPVPTVLVRKLAAPLTVDGDPQKWRVLGIVPQIIVSPPGVQPSDCSALVRMAWLGDDLYFQVIKFDDVVTMHQPLEMHYKQDSTEVALVGGFMGGYKFAITRTTDKGEILYREQFLMKKELNLDPALAPRVVKVLDNAAFIEERKLIENSYGVDLTNAKVIITEFKIPMTSTWDGKAPVTMASGTSFWMGLFIDDNDIPGLDEQRAHPWPVTFAAFGNPDQGARAVLE